jgi:hypothetical protein
MDRQPSYILDFVFEYCNILTVFMVKLTCRTLSKINRRIESFDHKLRLAINILDEKYPLKFLSWCPQWRNEFLVLAIGCIGNVHYWII